MYDPGRCRGGFGRRANKVVKMISPVRVFLSFFLFFLRKKKPNSNNHGPFVLNPISGAVTPPYADQSTMLLLEFV